MSSVSGYLGFRPRLISIQVVALSIERMAEKDLSPLRLSLDVGATIYALVVGAAIAGCGIGIDRLFHHATQLYASDAYTFLVACVLSYLLLMYEKRRRILLERRMLIAAEVNHHIRNALTAVVFSASVQNDPALEEVLKDATARINWVLTTVLPDGSKDLTWPVQSPEWRAGSWRSDHKAAD